MILKASALFFMLLASIFIHSASPALYDGCREIRIRREWRTLTKSQRAAWISGVKCLGSLKHRRLSFNSHGQVAPGLHSLYDDFAYTHQSVAESVHKNPYFLPWHRRMLYIFDLSMRDNCGYSGPTPYWDWSQDWTDLMSSPIFDSDPVHGLGRSGDCDFSDCVIQDGALSPRHSDFILSYPIPHGLRRNLTLIGGWSKPGGPNETISLTHIRNLTQHTTGDYFRFQYAMTRIHNRIHNFIGGDLAGTCPQEIPEDECPDGFSSNEPIFWLHHAQLDRLWSQWQSAHPENFFAFSGVILGAKNLTDPRYDLNASETHQLRFDRMSTSTPVSSVFNHSAPPFCYKYDA